QEPGSNELPGSMPDMQHLPASPGAEPPGTPQTGVASLLRTSGEDPLSTDSMQSSGGTGQGASDLGSVGGGRRQGSQSLDISLNSDFSGDMESAMTANQSAPQTPVSNAVGATPAASEATVSDLNNRVADMDARRVRDSLGPTQRLVRRSNPYENIPSLYDMY